MICDGCDKRVQKTIYKAEDGKHLCKECRGYYIKPLDIHMNFTDYVQQEAEEIVKDRIGKGVQYGKPADLGKKFRR